MKEGCSPGFSGDALASIEMGAVRTRVSSPPLLHEVGVDLFPAFFNGWRAKVPLLRPYPQEICPRPPLLSRWKGIPPIRCGERPRVGRMVDGRVCPAPISRGGHTPRHVVDTRRIHQDKRSGPWTKAYLGSSHSSSISEAERIVDSCCTSYSAWKHALLQHDLGLAVPPWPPGLPGGSREDSRGSVRQGSVLRTCPGRRSHLRMPIQYVLLGSSCLSWIVLSQRLRRHAHRKRYTVRRVRDRMLWIRRMR